MVNSESLQNIFKNLSIGGTGLASGAIGAVPSTISLLLSGGKWLGKQIDPDASPMVSDFLSYLQSGVEKATPEALRGYAEELSGGYLKPTTPLQKGVSELSQDVGTFLGFGTPAAKAIKLASAGNIAKQASSLIGASEKTSNYAKLFGMGAGSIFKKGHINTLRKSLYSDVRKSITSGSKTPSHSIVSAAKEVIKNASKGGVVPHKNAVIRFSKSILRKLKDKKTSDIIKKTAKGLPETVKYNKVPIDELWEFKKDLNDQISRGVFSRTKSALLKPLNRAIRSSLEKYGLKNKEFGHAFKNADTLHSIEFGLPILDKVFNKMTGLKKSGLSEYFRKSLAYGMGGLKGLLAKEAFGTLSKRGEAFLKSPAYRKACIRLANATLKNSTAAISESLRKLESIHKDFDSALTNKQGKRFKFVNNQEVENKQIKNTKPGKFKVLTSEELKARMGTLNQ